MVDREIQDISYQVCEAEALDDQTLDNWYYERHLDQCSATFVLIHAPYATLGTERLLRVTPYNT